MHARIRRLALLLSAAALPGAAASCAAEPPTVQLVIRADNAAAAELLEVTVRVTALIRTTAGDVVLCSPCERVFHPADGGPADAFPIVVDFVRRQTAYDEAWFIVTYRSAGPFGTTEGRIYHRMIWPEEGVVSDTVEIQGACLMLTCLPGSHCVDGACRVAVPEVPAEILDEAWGSRPCSASCSGPDADADAGADADARAEADADADSTAEVFDATADPGPDGSFPGD